jgi:hypothetical protein
VLGIIAVAVVKLQGISLEWKAPAPLAVRCRRHARRLLCHPFDNPDAEDRRATP